MNKITKIILSVLGACNEVMSMFIPIAVALLWINSIGFENPTTTIIIMTLASAASLFRGLKVWIK